MKLTVILTILVFFLVVICSPGETPNNLKKEVTALMEKLNNENLKREVKNHAEMLHEENFKKTAILFFYDIKAKSLLGAVLCSRDREAESGETKRLILQKCLDLFGPEDLLLLYEAALAHAEPQLLRRDNGGINAMEQGVVRNLAIHTTKTLGLWPTYPTLIIPHSAENIRAWWLKALRTAKNQATCPSPLDKAIKYLESQKEKNKEPN